MCGCSAVENNNVIKHNIYNYGLVWFFKASLYYHLHMCFIFWPNIILIYPKRLSIRFKFLNFINVEIGNQTRKCLYMFPSKMRICPLKNLTMQSMYITCCLADEMNQINTSTISILCDNTQISFNILPIKNAFLWSTKLTFRTLL